MVRRKFIEDILARVIYDDEIVSVELPEGKGHKYYIDVTRKVCYTLIDGLRDIGLSVERDGNKKRMLVYRRGEVQRWDKKIQDRVKERKSEKKN